MPKFYVAKVIENDDKTNHEDGLAEGRVQIYIEHIMHGFEPDHYPWARPIPVSSGGSNAHGTSFIPEIDSHIIVYFEDEPYLKNAFYLGDMNFKQKHPHTLFDDEVKSSVDGFSSEYPNVKYLYLKNGICIALSSDEANPEIVIYHPSSQLFINNIGDILIKDPNGNEIKMNAEGVTLKTGDAVNWAPCIITNCIFSNAPHGGVPAGIQKLKGE